jgi:heme/copper-type cytochrome/quinol oxidase subunit 2
VTIVVCNADHTQTHGFQIDNYLPPGVRVVSISPGQVFRVSFIANVAGKFRVYCFIFCTVHWAMQSGELIVTATT